MTTLDILIPAHNEGAIIVSTLRRLSEVLEGIPDLKWRIVVAENGSTDNTIVVVQHAMLPGVEIFSATERGKGAALKEGALRSDADYLAFLDADLSVDPASLIFALRRLRAGDGAIIVGSRFHPDTHSDRGILRHASSRVFNMLAQMIVGVRTNDTQCPLKIMNSEGKRLLLSCDENTWFLDLELIARAERAGVPIVVTPVAWTEFRYPERKSKLNVCGDGVRAVQTMFLIRKRFAREENNMHKS